MCDIHSALHYVYRVVPLSSANVNNDNTPSIPPQHRRRLLINGVISLPKKSRYKERLAGGAGDDLYDDVEVLATAR